MNNLVLPNLNELRRLGRSAENQPTKGIRVALLADSASQFLAGAIRGYAAHIGFPMNLWEGEFDQIELQVLNPSSELYHFKPDFVILYLASEKIGSKHGTLGVGERAEVAQNWMEKMGRLHSTLSAAGIQTICFNLADPGDMVFGSFGNKVSWSLTNQIRAINLGLAQMAQRSTDFHVYDLAALQATVGRTTMFIPSVYLTSKFTLSPQVLPLVARDVVKVISAVRGGGIKCVILDLDNTLWGGVVGDDGLERIQIGELGLGLAFSSFQSWLKQLRDRGIVLTVCSKNNDSNAREPFEKHPEMVLRLSDIAVFVANWKDKATNIREIKDIVDVDYGAMVFLDDNPVERQLVRESFPTMTIPDLPTDPADYLSFVQSLNLFETGSYTSQDASRTEAYQSEVKRRTDRELFVDPGDFLKSLCMAAVVESFNPFNTPRVAQLTQRSNQFNLRTVRYSEKNIQDLGASASHKTMAFSLGDKYGDHGIISVVILEIQGKAAFVDTWLMSCRVLSRGMEEFVLNTTVEAARSAGAEEVIGEYIPTAKNGMVKDHYPKLGFRPIGENRWSLEVATYTSKMVEIKRADSTHSTVQN